MSISTIITFITKPELLIFIFTTFGIAISTFYNKWRNKNPIPLDQFKAVSEVETKFRDDLLKRLDKVEEDRASRDVLINNLRDEIMDLKNNVSEIPKLKILITKQSSKIDNLTSDLKEKDDRIEQLLILLEQVIKGDELTDSHQSAIRHAITANRRKTDK